MIKQLIQKLHFVIIDHEVYEALWNKLPKEIHVEWVRDGRHLVGKVRADDFTFMTQAESAEEFVEMVNDSLFAVYEIPKKYFRFFSDRRFVPNKKQFKRLNDASVRKSKMGFYKKKLVSVS